MMWCAGHIQDISERMKKMKETQSGTYKGLELKSVDEEADPSRLPAADPVVAPARDESDET